MTFWTAYLDVALRLHHARQTIMPPSPAACAWGHPRCHHTYFAGLVQSHSVFAQSLFVSVSFSESSSSRFRHIAAANTRCDNSKAQARGLIAYTILHQPCKIGGGSRGHVLPASWRAGHMYQDTAQSPIFDCASSDQCTELTSRHLVSCARN